MALTMSALGCKTYHKVNTHVDRIRIDDQLEEVDEEMVEMIQPYKVELEEEMSRVLCYNSQMLEKGKPESTLTNWFSDLLMDVAREEFDVNLSFAVQNYGGIRRSSLPKGQVTVGLVYELMPFDNELVVLKMSGGEVQRFCDRLAGSGGWPVSRELRFTIEADQAVNVTVNDKPLDVEGEYYMVINDYAANGGDGLEWLRPLPRIRSGLLIRDGMIDHLEMTDTIRPVLLDGRITIEQ